MTRMLLIVIGIALVVRGAYLVDLSTYTKARSDKADILTACHLSVARDIVRKGHWVAHDDINIGEIELMRPCRFWADPYQTIASTP